MYCYQKNLVNDRFLNYTFNSRSIHRCHLKMKKKSEKRKSKRKITRTFITERKIYNGHIFELSNITYLCKLF